MNPQKLALLAVALLIVIAATAPLWASCAQKASFCEWRCDLSEDNDLDAASCKAKCLADQLNCKINS